MDDLFSRQQARRAALGQSGTKHPAKGAWEPERYRKRASPDQLDLDRILSLPIEDEFGEDQIVEFSREHLLRSAFDRGARFLGPQAFAITSFLSEGAGFFPIGVGFGKTGVAILCAELAYRAGVERILLMLPPQVYDQLIQQDIPFWRKMISLSVPIHRLGKVPMGTRRSIAKTARKGLYIMPYSLLSTADTMDLLTGIDADLVIADEVHNLKNRRAARTRRVIGWRDEREAEDRPVFLVAMSGTITNKSIDDYHHLISWALRDGSPLPKAHTVAKSWGGLINSGSQFVNEHQAGPLRPLVRWAHDNFPDKRPFRDTVSDFRRAFKLRLMSAPGVVCTGDAEIGTSLLIETLELREPSEEIQSLMMQVQNDYITPNGDEIECAFHTYKWLSELTSGFYNLLLWPEIEQIAKKTRGNEEKAEEALELGHEYHKEHQAWAKCVREFCEEAPLGLDTPMAIAKKIVDQQKYDPSPQQLRVDFPEELIQAYENMKEIERDSTARFGFLVERIGKVCRVDDFKVKSAIEWARGIQKNEKEGCILWYHHNAIGDWLRDIAQTEELEYLYAHAGENEEIIDLANKKKIVIASMGAHGTGKNLQHFGHQLFVQWPRHAPLAEQVIGRTHRTGQDRDELTVMRFDVGSFDSVNFAACLNDAVYIHQSTGQRQKLVVSRYNPLPKVFSPEFLREQGADPRMLNREQRMMMETLFGADWTEQL